MIRRFLLSALLLASTPAWAETLPQAIRADALRLAPQVETARQSAAARSALPARPLPVELVSGLQQFGFNTARLSLEIDGRKGPADLRCIFRGMAEETDVQLRAAGSAATGADQAGALTRISHMLRDAAAVAPAASLPSSNANAAGASAQAAFGQCKADRDF